MSLQDTLGRYHIAAQEDRSAHRTKLASAIYSGIELYFQGNAPDGTRLAAARRNAGSGPQVELR